MLRLTNPHLLAKDLGVSISRALRQRAEGKGQRVKGKGIRSPFPLPPSSFSHVLTLASLLALCSLLLALSLWARSARAENSSLITHHTSLLAHHSSLDWISDRAWLHPPADSSPFALSSSLSARTSSPETPIAVVVPLTGGGSITSFVSPLTENFDTLATSGSNISWTDNTTLSGGYSSRTTYNAGTGSSATGALYSFGVAGTNPVTDRALGGVASGTTGTIYFALKLTNNTGSNIGALSISYRGEQWRDGGAATPAAQTTNFQYQVANAGTITGANAPATGWTAYSALSFTSPTFTNTGGGAALDGNAAANRAAKSSTLVFPTSVANGQEIWIRWEDQNDAGNDHGLAIDDLSITALQPTATITGTVIGNHGNGSVLTGKTITLLKNGTSVGTTTTDGLGVYTFTGVTLASGDKITVYITGAVEKGATVTLAGTSDITGLNIFQKSLIVRSDNGSSISNNDLSNASDGSGDLISIYTVPGGALTTLLGTEIRIWNATTFAPANDIFDGGDWTNNGSFSAGASTVTLNGNLNQTIGGLNNSLFNNLTINNTGTSPNNVVSLGLDTNVGGVLTVGGGVFDQGASFNLVTTGNATNVVSVSSGATWSNLGTGHVTLSSGVGDAGTINFNANGTPCGDADSILIRSSINGTQRTWFGAGTFSMTDVDVQDQKVPGGVTLPLQVIVNSGTNSGNNTGWTFVDTCASGTYKWIGGANQDWTVPTNWTPTRVTPNTADVLVFDGATTPSPIVNNVPTETDAEIDLQGGAFVTLNASSVGAPQTLTLAGGGGVARLKIPGGNNLTLAGSSALQISLAGTSGGSLAAIDGTLIMQDAAHRLMGDPTNAITFSSGSIFTTAAGFIGNPFGAGTDGAVTFQSGSSGFFNAGGDPFGGSGHSVSTFNFGSTATFGTPSAFSSSGRSYGNLTLSNNQNYVGSGASQMTVGNDLTIGNDSTLTLSSSAGGDLNLLGSFFDNNPIASAFNANGRTTKFQGGNTVQTITKASGAESFFDVFISETAPGEVKLLSPVTIGGQLNLSTAASTIELNGQTLTLNGTITGPGVLKGDAAATLNVGGTSALGTVNFASGGQLLNSMTVNRTSSGSATLGTNLTIGSSLTLTNGILDAGSNTLSLGSAATASHTNGYLIGNLQKSFGASGNLGTFTFPVGTANAYSPLDANVTANTNGTLTVKAVQGKQPNFSGTNALQRYWTLAGSGLTANLTFHYSSSSPNDIVGTEANYKIFKYNGSFTQFTPDATGQNSPQDHYATLNNVSSFSDWTLAEPTCTPPSTVYVDDNWVGTPLGTDPDGGGPATNFGCDSFATIQDGVNGVAPGGTVIVKAGSYTEQVTISKSLTLTGENTATTVLHTPATLSPRIGGTFTLVQIDSSAVVNMSGITISGPFATGGCSDPTYYGVFVVGGANLNLHDAAVTDIRLSPNSLVGCQTGIAVRAGSLAFGQVATLTANNVAISGYQKSAIIVDNTGSTGTISNNTLTGLGPQNIAANAIQISRGAGVTITGNTITGNECSASVCGPDPFSQFFSTGVLIFSTSATIQVNSNTISSNDTGIYNNGDDTTISGNTMPGNRYNGIFLDQGTGTLTGNTLSGPMNVGVAVVSFSAADGTTGNSVGTMTGNTVTGADSGLQLLDADQSDSFEPLLTAHFNRIVSVTKAVSRPSFGTPTSQNQTTVRGSMMQAFAAIDGRLVQLPDRSAQKNPTPSTPSTNSLENNWWGCNAGPGNPGCGSVGGTSVVDFNPWIVLAASATPNSIIPGGTSNVALDMTHNSAGAVPSGTLPNIPDSFSATNGTMNPTSNTVVAGADSSIFTSTNGNSAVATVTVDNQSINVPITVNAPSFSIDDVTHLEGNSGTTSFTFTITKTGSTALNSSVDYQTVDGTATSPSDFTAIPVTTLQFLPGDVTKQITVFVNGDTTPESDEKFTVHLSNAVNASISHADGLGTILDDDTCTPPSTVYVDKSWAGTTPGTDPDGAGPATKFGCDSFATIQDGINGVTAGGTVIVHAGNYPENVLVNKSVTLLGPNSAIDPNTGSRVAEAIVMPAVTETSVQASTSGTVFRVGNNSGHVDATIKGFTIDGHNGSLTGGRTLNGVQVDTGAGIVNSSGSFDSNPGAYDATMIVQNNIIQNLERYGVLADNVPSRPAVTGTDVSHNKLDNLPSGNNFGGSRGRGIAFEENLYGTATYNVMTRVNVGWQDDNYNLASPGAATLVSHNTIHTYHRGIFHNLQYQSASDATISDNSIFVETTGDFAATTTNFGVELASIQSGVGATVTNNSSTGNVYGILLWNLPTTADITVSGGTLSGNNYGVFATSNDPQFGAGAASHSIISGVSITGATVAGIGIDDSGNIAQTSLGITGGTTVNGGPLGLLINGPGARVLNNNLNDTAFTGQSGNYITLQNGASAGLEINGASASFDGLTGSTATLNQIYSIEDKITDAIDDGSLGFVRLKAANVYVTPNSFTATTLTPNIQRAVNAATSGDTLHAAAGLYPNNVTVNKALVMQGANVGIAGAGVRGAESIVRTNGNQVAVIAVTGASNVNIDGFTIDGDDPAVTGAALKSGDDANVQYGVRPTGALSNLTVANNIVKHVFIGLRGDVASQGNLVTNNWFDSVGNFDFGYCVSIRNNFYANVTNNKMTRAWTGVHINNHNGAGGPANFNIANNEIHSYAAGILYWLQFNGATSATISGNNISAETGAVANNFGMLIVSVQNALNPAISGNTISDTDYGVGLTNTSTTNVITLGATNSISATKVAGVYLTDNLTFNPIGTTDLTSNPYTGPANNIAVNLNGLTVNIAAGSAVKVENSRSSAADVTSTATITGSTLGGAGSKGLEVIGPMATANMNSSTITGLPTGISLQDSSGTPLAVDAHFNRIIATTAIDNSNNQVVNLENNWWGCNAGPGNTGCGAVTGTGADFNPWIVLGISASPNPTTPGGNSTATADMTHNSDNVVPVGVTTLPLPNASFTATHGTMSPPSNSFTAGQSQSTFTSTDSSNGSACATVDNQQVCTAVNVTAPSFTIDDVTHFEGNSGTTIYAFTVTKNGATTFSSSVDFQTQDNTATLADNDYQSNAGTLTFGPSDTAMQITVLVNGDTKFEPDEKFFVHLSNPTNATISHADGTGTIQNDDAAPTFTIDDVSMNEGDAGQTNFVFTVTKSGATALSATVDFATANGTTSPATGGGACGGAVDYVSQSGTLNFSPTDTTKTITVQVCGDTMLEPDETFFVNLSNPGNASIAGGQGVGTILNDDCDPFPSGMVSWWSGEGNANDIFGTNSGTFAANTYATGKVGQAFSFSGGGRVLVPHDASQNTGAQLTADAWIFPTTFASNSGSIINKRTAGNSQGYTLELPFFASGLNFEMNTTNGAFSLSAPGVLTTNQWQHVAVTYDGALINLYVNGAVVASTSASGSITPVTADLEIGHNIVNGTSFPGLIDEVELFNRALTQPEIQSLSDASGAGKCHTSTMEFSSATYQATEGTDTAAVITVTRNGAHDTTASVHYATSDGTATAGTDYTNTSGDLNLAVGEVSKTFGVPILQDSSFAHDQTVNLTLSVASGSGVSLGTPNSAVLTIHDTDDAVPVFSITQSVTHAEGNSGTTDFVFTVTKTGATQLASTVDFATANGTTNPATGGVSCGAGVDYQSQNGTLNFAANQTTQTITIKVCGDTTYEANETFKVTLSNPTEATVSLSLGTGIGTINNDDAAPTLSINNVSKNEGNSGPTDFAFTVTKTGATEQPASVNFATVDGIHNSNNTGATGGGACGPGIDYVSQSGTLTFQPSDTTMTIHVTVCGDPNYENDELFFINLTSPTNATISANPGTGTIKNDDPIPTLSIDDVSMAEGDSGTTNFVFHVTKTGATEFTTTVHAKTINHPSGEASAPSDFTAITDQTLTFPPSGTTDTQTVTVQVNGDTVYEHDELFFVGLSSATNAQIVQFNGTGTILNDDPAPTISINDVTMAEGNSGTTNFTFTITKTGSTEVNATVDFQTQDGTATTADNDYQSKSGTLMFLPGETTKTITVLVNGDTRPEADETFFVNLSNPVDCTITQAQGTGTIQNDDPCPTSFTVDDNGDADDANPGDGLCATSGGVCTLRAAIEEANALTACGTIDINFSIGSSTITLSNGQLTVNHNVNINGPAANSVVISGNSVSRIFTVNSGKTAAISNLTLSGGNGSGGGAIQNNGTLTLTGVTLNSNTSSADGGAIRNDGTLTLINTTISGNTASADGGGILCGIAHTVNIVNTTIVNNTASGSGGGINTGGTVNVRNSIVALNNPNNITGTLNDQGNNILSGDPLIGALMNNGGPTFTHGLLYNSPAIDAGDNCAFDNTCSPSLGAALTTDQRGLSRKADGDLTLGAVVDIGAYERQPTETRTVPSGSSTHVDLNDVRLVFATTSAAQRDAEAANGVQPNGGGNTVSITPIPVPGDAPPGSGPAFDVTPSSAFYTPPVDVCFYLPSITNQTTFNTLKILHREGGTLMDHGSFVSFASKIVCTTVSSFSDFVITHGAGPSAANGTISGRITDGSGNPIAGVAIALSGGQSRETITDANGSYNFFEVATNGFYTVTPSRANYTFSPANRSFSLLGDHTEASFTAATNGDHANAIDTIEFFVRQQYLDFLGREPDPQGFNGWVATLRNCAPGDMSCDRIHVSESFFRSAEFQERGYFIYRFYSTAFGRKPDYAEFTPDLARVSGFLTSDQLEAAKVKFIDDFMARPAFASQYGSLSNAAYVDALINTAAANLSNRHALIDSLNNGTAARAQVLRQIAESGEVYQRYYNQAFVVMEYFGYLRRDPDGAYTVWIDVLNANPSDSRHMVDGFVSSIEYRNRFAQ